MKHGLTPATRTIAREFRTSPMMLRLMHGDGSGPADAKTRRLLQNSSSDSVLAAVAGLPPIPDSKKPNRGSAPRAPRPARSPQPGPLDAARKAVLYSTACSRVAHFAKT